ncbi:MAG: PorT family protein [Chitinophagales bacterium]|jgi:hypothetical protein|nr:PorT family protein [Chitinophagales bacterium]
MKYILSLFILLVFLTSSAQSNPTKPLDNRTPEEKITQGKHRAISLKRSVSDFMVNFTIDNIIRSGNDTSYQAGWFNPNIGFYYMHDVSLGKSKLSIAPGLGFTFSKINLDKRVLVQDAAGIFFEHANVTYNATNRMTYTGSSFYNSWIEIPLELRYRTNPISGTNSFKFAIGMRAGLRLASNSKVSYIDAQRGDEVTITAVPFTDVNPFRYGATLRIGYGAFNIFGYYGLNQLFKENRNTANADLKQYSIGLSISGM